MRIITLLSLALLFPFTAAADTPVAVGPFRSIELNNGGHVIVRHGAVQRVAIVEGDLQYTRVRVEGQRLIVDTRSCPRGYELEIVVVTPHLDGVRVANGGSLRARGSFPDQASLDAEVEQGGTIDVRSIAADEVDASVFSGGGIFVTARKTLKAGVDSGGSITYEGEVDDVRKSISRGGSVRRAQ